MTHRRPTADRTPRGLTLLGRRAPLPDSPDTARLETFRNPCPRRAYWVRFDCPEFTSICPVTGQPDFGRLDIVYAPARRCIESKSLKLYLGSYRNHGTFHEAAVNRILADLVKACRPRRARVTGRFNARGGIAIEVQAEHPAAARGALPGPARRG